MRELTECIRELAVLAGDDKKMDEFSQRYEALLTELTSAMTAMKQLAVAQGLWLGRQAASIVRMN